MFVRRRGTGLRVAVRRIAEAVDRRYSRTLRRMRFSGPASRVLVVGIYREAQPIAALVDELRVSRHDVEFRLGAMAEPADELVEETAAAHLTAGKFQNLNVLVEGAAPSDWLVIVDDDVVLPQGFLDQAIELCERLDLSLAQPAQTRFSNANWRIAKQRFATIARTTRFVEIGPVTLMRADAQALLLPFPADLRYGWGLDFHWARLVLDAGLRMGVLDALAVVHSSRKVASTYSWEAAQEEGRAYLSGVPHVDVGEGTAEGLRRYRRVPSPRA